MTSTNGTGSATPGIRSHRGSSGSISSQEARSEIIARVRRGSASGGALGPGIGMTALRRRLSEGQNLKPGPILRRKSSRTDSAVERTEDIIKLRALLEEEKRKPESQRGVGNGRQEQLPTQQPNANSREQHRNSSRSRVKETHLRCKMCRRDLAAREHVLEHEVGQGQKAFAPQRRDMTQHRIDSEKKRLETQQKAEARRLERQKSAAEAAEDLLQEVDDAVNSGPETEEEATQEVNGYHATESSDSGAKKSAKLVIRRKVSSDLAKSWHPKGASPRTLSARLPPNLAGLRVSRPQPLSHDFSNGQNGSAIADDDMLTPISDGFPSPPLLPSTICTSYFTEPLSWMQSQLETGELSGKILCPNKKCGAKLGNFDWSGRK